MLHHVIKSTKENRKIMTYKLDVMVSPWHRSVTYIWVLSVKSELDTSPFWYNSTVFILSVPLVCWRRELLYYANSLSIQGPHNSIRGPLDKLYLSSITCVFLTQVKSTSYSTQVNTCVHTCSLILSRIPFLQPKKVSSVRGTLDHPHKERIVGEYSPEEMFVEGKHC